MRSHSQRRRLAVNALAALAAVVLAAILASCGSSGDSTSSTAPTKTEANASGCKEVEAPAPKHVSFKAPKQVLKPGEEATAVVKTSCGTFEIALDTKRAPKTANSFAFLAEEGFYGDLTFHRVVPGFVIQGGDPEGTGTGGPGYTVTEKPPPNLAYTKGVVAMAKSEADPPGRSGSQFYVVTAPDAGLPPEYALVGKVSKGFDAVTRIEELGGGPEERPKQTVLIEEVTIEHG
ncbi:MAG TPA: peptidylprolyl isomerase [Solirubrobacterales bacterium]|nr:peptidylprolyl isomerase [Solirubrobacterales bacterium]